ncbi:taste receptor type 2 member 40-like [Mantella aurantiaca]
MSMWNIAVFTSWASGIFLNSLIVTMYIRDWGRGLILGICDQILFIMSISNVLLQIFTTLDRILSLFGVYPLMPAKTFLFFTLVVLLLNDISFWNTAWLSIYYCIKLVSFSHRFLINLRACFPPSVMGLVLGSSVTLVLINILFFFKTQVKLMNTIINNKTISFYQPAFDQVYVYIHVIFGFSIPCSMTFICIGLSILTLLAHIRGVRKNTSQLSSSPQVEGLLRAACTMASQAVLELSISLMMMSAIASSFSVYATKYGGFIWTSLMLYPSIQSIILILGNSKIKNRLLGRS